MTDAILPESWQETQFRFAGVHSDLLIKDKTDACRMLKCKWLGDVKYVMHAEEPRLICIVVVNN